MKYLMLLVAGLAWTHVSATPDTAWRSALALMNDRMRDVRYESYDYEATTILPNDSSQTQRGSLYLNRPDTMLYHVIGPVTMVFSSDLFLRSDDEQRLITSASFSGGNTKKRDALLGTFFNVGEALALLEGMLKNAKLIELRNDAATTLIRLEITDGVSYTNQATISLDPKTNLLQEIRYEVVRHTDFRKPTPATDYRQIVRCYNYRWNRDALAESKMVSSAKAIQQLVTTNTYKVTQL